VSIGFFFNRERPEGPGSFINFQRWMYNLHKGPHKVNKLHIGP
jgi:hypothetical protein